MIVTSLEAAEYLPNCLERFEKMLQNCGGEEAALKRLAPWTRDEALLSWSKSGMRFPESAEIRDYTRPDGSVCKLWVPRYILDHLGTAT